MTDPTDAATPSLVIHEDSDTTVVDESIDELHQQVATLKHRIAGLEDELGDAADEEAETTQRLDA